MLINTTISYIEEESVESNRVILLKVPSPITQWANATVVSLF